MAVIVVAVAVVVARVMSRARDFVLSPIDPVDTSAAFRSIAFALT